MTESIASHTLPTNPCVLSVVGTGNVLMLCSQVLNLGFTSNQVVHIIMVPRMEYDLPIFAMDMVSVYLNREDFNDLLQIFTATQDHSSL